MFFKTDIKKIDRNAISLIAQDWMLITAGTEAKFNTMTASWGALGELWGKDCAFVFVRPQRYTREFIDANEYFSLCFFGEEKRAALALCGAKSGRDTDKINEAGLVPAFIDGVPCFEGAKLVLICRKIAAQQIDPSGFIDPQINGVYEQGDYHIWYTGEITAAYENKN